MGFSESIKEAVKRKAAFKCCRCHELGVEIHHIIPQSEGGSDDIENAAPLCPSCHSLFGDNPLKRKEITQMRNWWYEVCRDKYLSPGIVDLKTLKTIDFKLEQIKAGQENQENIVNEIKQTLTDVVISYIDKISAGTAATSASAIVNAAEVRTHTWGSMTKKCPNCGYTGVMNFESPLCPECGFNLTYS